MKLFERQLVDETTPKVYIGRRIFNNRQGPQPVEAVIENLLARQDLGRLNDAVAYAADLRQCIEPLKCQVKPLKKPVRAETTSDAAFVTLCDLLRTALPPVPVRDALAFAQIGDDYRGETTVTHRKGRASEVRRHFTQSSSSGRKGRLLSAAVRSFQPRLVLELGTAYGISGFFIASALKAINAAEPGRLVTVEGFEPQATLSRNLLQSRFGSAVEFEFGVASHSIPRLAERLSDVDFYFHDAGHTYADYVHDVTTMLPKMASGSVLLLDDIRWDDRRFTDTPSRAYEGWQAIVNHPRTRAAAEIDGELGIVVFD
ncbi:MAG TPA: class I SAM-dependent methyltransferase [Tepidisphaeraceae bacterium]|jgi:predicted O-methyltransferase YrrM